MIGGERRQYEGKLRQRVGTISFNTSEVFLLLFFPPQSSVRDDRILRVGAHLAADLSGLRHVQSVS